MVVVVVMVHSAMTYLLTDVVRLYSRQVMSNYPTSFFLPSLNPLYNEHKHLELNSVYKDVLSRSTPPSVERLHPNH